MDSRMRMDGRRNRSSMGDYEITFNGTSRGVTRNGQGRGRDMRMDYGYDMARKSRSSMPSRDRVYEMDERRNRSRDRMHEDMEERRKMRERDDYDYDEMYDNGYDRNYDDYDSHYEMEYNQSMFLDRKAIKRWMSELENADGTMGAKFNKEQVSQKVEQMGLKSRNVEPDEWYAAVNMFYSDYCKTLGGDIQLYLKMAKDFFDDADAGLQGGEKLAAYYYCIVDA